MAGPGVLRRRRPVRTKMPAPMMAPIPRVIRFVGPSTRLSECSPVSWISDFSCSMDFVANSDISPVS